jgi:hypothetical protein
MDRVRQLPVGSERVTTDSFSRWPGKRSHMARPWAQAVLLPNQSEARGAFSWTNQCEELTAGSARRGGLEFVLTEWLYVGVDPRLVLALDAGYLALSARRQSDRWRFNLRHLHGKRAGVVRFSDFALDIRRMAPRQPLVGHAVTVERHSLELTVFGQIDPPVLISNGIPSCYRDSGRLLTGRHAHEHRDFGRTSWHPSLSPSSKSDAPDGSESESNLPFFEDGRSLGGEEPALLPLKTGAQRSWSARSNTVSNVQMSPSESSPAARPCTARRRAVAALGS